MVAHGHDDLAVLPQFEQRTHQLVREFGVVAILHISDVTDDVDRGDIVLGDLFDLPREQLPAVLVTRLII